MFFGMEFTGFFLNISVTRHKNGTKKNKKTKQNKRATLTPQVHVLLPGKTKAFVTKMVLQYSIFVSLYIFCNTICIFKIYTVQYTLLWPRTFGLAYLATFYQFGLAHLATFYRVLSRVNVQPMKYN